MEKYTIEQLYRGDKHNILSAVGAKAILSNIDPHTEDGQTRLEMEHIRQTIITIEKMKQNGDCIAEGELGDAVTVFVSRGEPVNRAMKRMKKHRCPAGEDPAEWFDKLIIVEKIDRIINPNKENTDEYS